MTIEQRLEQLEKCNKRLTGADLRRTNLAWAHLAGANLTNANLSRADLTGANLVDVRNLPELSAKQEKDACWDDCG